MPGPWMPIANGVIGWLSRRSANQAARRAAQAKLDLAKQEGAQDLQLHRAEWENLQAAGLANTWKDEWVLIIFTAPLVVLLAGALIYPWSPTLMEGGERMLQVFDQVGVDYNYLLGIVVLASVGIRVFR